MKIVTFGEILLRLAAPGFNRLFQSNLLEASFCGAEANVAVSLANFGLESFFVTKVPEGIAGQAAINSLRSFGVETEKIARGGGRLGLYYLEKGASQRPSVVLYDRAQSSFANSCESDFDWDTIFEGAKCFHFSGINPALGDNVKKITENACKVAKEKKLLVSCDINYRNKLWQVDNARQVMGDLLRYVDLCITNEEDAATILGIPIKDSDFTQGVISYDAYKEAGEKICKKFGVSFAGITLRTSISANQNKWAGILFSAEENQAYLSKEYNIHVVDRVGSGDSFAAGLIFGLLKQKNPQEVVDFAAASSCLQHSIEGDFNRVSIDEVEALMAGEYSGRIKR